jgi:hypothetical protein
MKTAAAFLGKVRYVTPHNRVDYATRWPSLWDVIISAMAQMPPSQSPSTFPVSSHKRYVMPPLVSDPRGLLTYYIPIDYMMISPYLMP